MTPWAHVMSSFRGQWLPGDERGFRDHGARAISTGNTERPPPAWEHRGLRGRSELNSQSRITLSPEDYEVVGSLLIEKLRAIDSKVGALAVTGTHCHALLEVGHGDAVKLFGRAKQFVSHRMREAYPGKLWGASSHVVRMQDLAQIETVRRYILAHRNEGAWAWPLR